MDVSKKLICVVGLLYLCVPPGSSTSIISTLPVVIKPKTTIPPVPAVSMPPSTLKPTTSRRPPRHYDSNNTKTHYNIFRQVCFNITDDFKPVVNTGVKYSMTTGSHKMKHASINMIDCLTRCGMKEGIPGRREYMALGQQGDMLLCLCGDTAPKKLASTDANVCPHECNEDEKKAINKTGYPSNICWHKQDELDYLMTLYQGEVVEEFKDEGCYQYSPRDMEIISHSDDGAVDITDETYHIIPSINKETCDGLCDKQYYALGQITQTNKKNESYISWACLCSSETPLSSSVSSDGKCPHPCTPEEIADLNLAKAQEQWCWNKDASKMIVYKARDGEPSSPSTPAVGGAPSSPSTPAVGGAPSSPSIPAGDGAPSSPSTPAGDGAPSAPSIPPSNESIAPGTLIKPGGSWTTYMIAGGGLIVGVFLLYMARHYLCKKTGLIKYSKLSDVVDLPEEDTVFERMQKAK